MKNNSHERGTASISKLYLNNRLNSNNEKSKFGFYQLIKLGKIQEKENKKVDKKIRRILKS